MTKLRAAPLVLALLFSMIGMVGCKAGAAGKFIEPDKPKAGEAMGELTCAEDQKRAEPLIVDWSSDDRTDLEVAMRDGIVVASYDCNSFRVLENCRASGGYSFAGVGRKQDVVQIVGQDELHANFPLGKASFTAALDRGSTIDVALVTVGKHRTSAFQVAHADIAGDCEGATHFVSSAVVGAFAVGTGTRGHISSVAEVFKIGDIGGSSTSEQQSLNRDGDLAACEASNPTDPSPPAQCQAILRVELVALADVKVETPIASEQAQPLEQICPTGFVLSDGKCTREAQAKGFRCKSDDVTECTSQCEAGNAESCHNLAVLVERGDAGEKDVPRAIALYQTACETGNPSSCNTAALRLDWKAEPERVTTLLQTGCEGGNSSACFMLGGALIRGDRLAKDTGRGEQLLTRSCSLADLTMACPSLARYLADARKQPKQALEILEADCSHGNPMSCAIAGGWLSQCEDGRPPGASSADVKVCESFPTTDDARATQAYERACRTGFIGTCGMAADRTRRGKGVTSNLAVALELLDLGCPGGRDSCGMLGKLYEDGDGVKQDLDKALAAYGDGCDSRSKTDCFGAAQVAEKLGKDDVRRARLEAGCKLLSKLSCDAWTKILEAEGRKDEAKAIYSDVCARTHLPDYCDAYERLGGKLEKGFKPIKRPKDRDPDDF